MLTDTDTTPVIVNLGCWKWPSGEDTSSFKLKDISLGIQRGSTVAIVGKVGSGKSSLLEALLGNLELESGECSVKGRLAYCSQEPWIMSGSIKENITFGQEYNHERMLEIVKACGLVSDLNEFSYGLDTMIGERGINLSGGQKARVALARAIYSDADVYLLDCPLAALDATVSRRVFQKAILGLLKDKTVLMVSHNLLLLNHVNQVVVMDEGRIFEMGSFQDLCNGNNGFFRGESQFQSEEGSNHIDDLYGDDILVDRMNSHDQKSALKEKEDSKSEGIIKKETKRFGMVKLDIYKEYVQAMGILQTLFLGIIAILNFTNTVLIPFWFIGWINNNNPNNFGFYITGFFVLGGIEALSRIFSDVFPRFVTITIACSLHDSALIGVFNAPLHFFESNPVGRIVQRFTGDLFAIEWSFYSLMGVLSSPMHFLGNVVLVLQSSWVAILPIPVCIFVGNRVYKLYVRANTEFNRVRPLLQSATMSQVKEIITGTQVFQVFGIKSHILKGFFSTLDAETSAAVLLDAPQVWYAIRISLYTAFTVLVVGLWNARLPLIGQSITAGNAASIAFSLQLLTTLDYAFQTLSQFESSMASIERLVEYKNLTPEKERLLPDDPPKEGWPSKGSIEFKDLKIAYPSEPTIPVLKSINLEIKGGEKIGVVGRTGAGKSTTLFRIIDEYEGKVSIDGLDISTVGLVTLRTRLFIILQDPVLFEGTLRSNLDPGEEFTEDQLWEALDTCGLKDHVSSFPLKLEEPITEKGSQFSLGQRQLFMIAIALLKKPKIIVFDESTSAMDHDSDQMIQKVIKEQFKQSTVISIAHRLNTIIEYDRVLVLDQGNVVDFDSPSKLLDNPESLFYQMAQATGESWFNDLTSKARISCNTNK